jgi:hypothetical protein
MVFLFWFYLSCTLSRLASPKFDSSAKLFLKIFFPALVGSYLKAARRWSPFSGGGTIVEGDCGA